VFADLHTDHGVDLRCDVAVTAIRPDPAAAGTVLLADGTELAADVVIVGVGITPNIALARSCGLNVANAYHPLLGRQLRVEHWANALHQPVVAAKTMLGQTATYDRLPYFFTDQYDLGMEYLGYTDPDGYDQVVIRGDTASRELSRSGYTTDTWWPE
jgi:3-phenylpropionate/trans-cinnamate dioxygenase ferredoxin reductase subunit